MVACDMRCLRSRRRKRLGPPSGAIGTRDAPGQESRAREHGAFQAPGGPREVRAGQGQGFRTDAGPVSGACHGAREALRAGSKFREQFGLERAKLFEQDQQALDSLKQTFEAKSSLQSTTQQGTDNFTWSNDNDRVAVKWTGAFRLSDDDKDIVWVEAGKTVQVSDGGRVFSTGVEVKGLADGKVERSYYRNGFTRTYEPEGREFLATMLQKVVRVSGFAADSRVERFLKQGGVPAVLAEIELLQGDYARRVYYRELMKQAKVLDARAHEDDGPGLRDDWV